MPRLLCLDDPGTHRETTPCAPPVMSRKCHACYAWTTLARIGRPPPAHPLWCRGSATPALFGRPWHTKGDYPQRPPYGVEKVPRLPRPASLQRTAAAVRDHPLRTPLWCRGYAMPAVPRATVTDSGRGERPPPAHPLWCREYAMPAVPWTTVTDSGRGERPPPAQPHMVSRMCHACYPQRPDEEGEVSVAGGTREGRKPEPHEACEEIGNNL